MSGAFPPSSGPGSYSGWPPGPPPPPPPPGYGPAGYGAPPPRRRRGLWIGLGALALALVVGLGIGGWLFATGRLGFGPLSAADTDAAAVIADGVEGPAWASAEDRRCAADALLTDRRSSTLADTGLIEESGDSWTYTGAWERDDAVAFSDHLVDCVGDWEAAVGEEWGLDETACLSDLGPAAMADYVVVDTLALEDETSVSSAEDTVDGLDACYADAASAPRAEPEPAYRAVRFVFADSAAASGVTVLYDGRERSLSGGFFRARGSEGDEELCITARMTLAYPWGTSDTAEQESCGTTAPKEIEWRALRTCADTSGGPCRSWGLYFNGFASGSTVSALLQENGGDCGSVSGQCTFAGPAPLTGRGLLVTWSAPTAWNEPFTATVGDLIAVLPN